MEKLPIMSVQNLSQDEKQERVRELRKKMKADELLEKCPNADDTYLQRFLGGTSFDVDAAFDRMKTYYELLLEFPEWFTIDSPLKKKHIIEQNIRVALPETDKEGRPIYLAKLGNCNAGTMELMDVVAVDDIWLESIFLHYPTDRGLCVIIDISNFPWKCFKWITPHNVRMSVKKIQTLPFKDFQFHVVKKHVMRNTIIKMIWPLLPEYLKQMIKFHFNDWQSFHNHIDPTVLPEEYGGTKGEINYDCIYQKLYEQNEQIFESLTLSRNIQANK